jgi:hypothetical protein
MARFRARCEWWKHGDVDADGPSTTCETEAEIEAWLASPEIVALRARASGSSVPMFFAVDTVTGREWPLIPR